MTIKTTPNPNISRYNTLFKQKRLSTNLSLYCEICGWTGYKDPFHSIQLYHILPQSNQLYIKPTERDEEQELIDIKRVSNSILMLCPNHLSIFNQMIKYPFYRTSLDKIKEQINNDHFINNDLITIKKGIIDLIFKFENNYLETEEYLKINNIRLPEKIYDKQNKLIKQYFIPTGEFRIPKRGEYYLHGLANGYYKIVKNDRNLKMSRIILIPKQKEMNLNETIIN